MQCNMFCTSLRRRPSFASIVPRLNASPLVLRESQLGTHDLEIAFESTVDLNTAKTSPARHLRVLLISPTGACEARLNETLQRIQHFAALTGGQDLIIVFVLNPPLATSFVTAKDLAANSRKGETSIDGIYAFSKLQAEMVNHPEIPHVPILPLSEVDGVQKLLQKHIANLTRVMPTTKPFTSSLELLNHCTANPPMSQQTAYILSDLFSSIGELARACSSATLAPYSSSPSARVGGESSQLTGVADPDIGKLRALRDLVGDREYGDIVDFWKEEWTID